ncbi:CHASE domain-containing protein [Hydrogenophaga intermedia]|uniref:Sensory/regulatory protein RpfC n=1 Tax=Hydrogenophaga intermedia TaxID=65786 RepID=A0A1L1PWQ9_HYDIT|nr:CHASE domain-containing protein [Hydrogenophaga intermedia]TMU72340.1 response regulator [Hydrogenophaga intermedia]CDN89071.1 Signal transduction histidine kinase [Hydrogenophaga intermedia]
MQLWRVDSRSWLWVAVTLLCGGLLTAVAVDQRERTNEAYLRARFEAQSRELADDIAQRFDLVEQGLRAARGVARQAGEFGLGAADFRDYMHSRDIEREYPGVRGFGFMRRLPPGGEAAYRSLRQRLGVADAPIRSHEPNAGERIVVELVEPLERNHQAVGLDVAPEPGRRALATASVRRNLPLMTGPTTLVQAPGAPAFVVMLPVFRRGAPIDTPQARDAAAYGWVYSPLVFGEVIESLALHEKHIALTLTDITEPELAEPFFSTVNLGEAPQADAPSQALLRVPFGRSWAIQTTARPSFAAQFNLPRPAMVAWTGALGTLLVAALQGLWLNLRRRHRQAAELNARLEDRVAERTHWLEDAERFQRTVLDAVPSMISYWDREQINRVANRANLRWHRPRGGALAGYSVREAVGEAVYERLRPRIEAVLDGRQQVFEVSVTNPATGEPRELRLNYLPDARHGVVHGWYAIVDDVTERNRNRRELEAALALQATERLRLESILAGTNAGTWEWNMQTREARFNERWAEMLGHDYDELRPTHVRAWADHVHPDDLALARQRLRRHIKGELPFYECEVRMRHAQGHWIWVLDRGRLQTRTADGEPEWMYGTAQDISASKAIEQSLREATRAAEAASQSKSAFLANMSHEIRTPLNAVLGVAHLLADTPLDTAQRQLLNSAQTAGRSLLGIVNDVLDLAKIEAGEMRLADEPFALCGLLREVESVYALPAREKGLTLSLRMPEDVPPYVRGDAARLRQVLVNLVGNALKFTQQGGIVISAEVLSGGDGPQLRLSVHDSGIGIPPEVQARLFQPFTQADETTTRRFGGTGLGLSIVRRLVALMGGEVGLSSEPGRGSEFWLRVALRPAEAAELPRPAPAPASSDSHGLTGLTVLLVDDSEINLDIARRMLERQGARVQTCGDGEQALGWLRASPAAFDVVLMDVQMPVMDGLEATNRIRNELRLVDLPVIALTAGALADERRRALQAGFTNFLAKPIDPEEMIDAVRRAASARAATTAPAPLTVLPVPQPPSQPPVAVPAGWPAIDGIDTKAARRQLGGDHVLFQRLLTRLLAEHGDWAALSANAAAGWDGTARAAWRARAHRLRGSAGVLGAQALARAATALEAALEPDAETAPAGPALAAVRTAFDALRAAAPADGVERRSPVQAAPITDADAAASAARIERLAEQLQAQDLEGVDTFEACRAALEVRLGAERVQALAKAIDNLEFAAARQFLDDALAWHDDTKA